MLKLFFPSIFWGVITVLVSQVGNNEDTGRGRGTTLYPGYFDVKTFDLLSLIKRRSMLEVTEKKKTKNGED